MTTDIRWTMRPEDAGQAIRVEYALTGDGDEALRRTTDADGGVTIECSDGADLHGWHPVDGDEPPVADWQWTTISAPCECPCDCDGQYDDDGYGEGYEGSPMCSDCRDYYVGPGGDVICPRMQDDETCRHCSTSIAWGPVHAGPIGGGRWMVGRCECQEWRQEEYGSQWVMEEIAETDRD